MDRAQEKVHEGRRPSRTAPTGDQGPRSTNKVLYSPGQLLHQFIFHTTPDAQSPPRTERDWLSSFRQPQAELPAPLHRVAPSASKRTPPSPPSHRGFRRRPGRFLIMHTPLRLLCTSPPSGELPCRSETPWLLLEQHDADTERGEAWKAVQRWARRLGMEVLWRLSSGP